MALPPAILAALRTLPQDPDRFLVLADRLQAEGDVRGELISLQARRAEDPEQTALALAEERYLTEHAKSLLGRLWTSPSSYVLHWELGFIRHALIWAQELDEQQSRVPHQRPGPRPRRGKLSRLTADLLELESAALLETLTLGLPRSGVQMARMLDAVSRVAHNAPPTLRLLQLRNLVRDHPEDDYPPRDWRLPDYEPGLLRQVTWRGRAFTLSSDSLSLDAVTEALGAWDSLP
jgi:hypothetical protein